MFTAVTQWLTVNALRIAGWVAIAASVAAVLFGARQSGKNAERVDNLKKSLEARNAQLHATVNAPRNRTELVKRLRNGKL